MRACSAALEHLGRAQRAMNSLPRPLRAHSSCGSHQSPPRHPEVAQREQRDDLRRVLLQPAVTHLRVAKLPLEHAERVLDAAANMSAARLAERGKQGGLVGWLKRIKAR